MNQPSAHPVTLFDEIARQCERLAIHRPDLGSLAINDFSTPDTDGKTSIIGYQVFEASPKGFRAIARIRTDDPEAGLRALSAFGSDGAETATPMANDLVHELAA